MLTASSQGQFSASVYNFAGAWVARKYNEIFGDVQGDPADHPELLSQLKQAVDKDLKVDYLVTGGCMTTQFGHFWFQSRNAKHMLHIKNGGLM
jgi:hypothetical protein